MAADRSLLAPFEAGRLSYLEGQPASDCPHYATSDNADAWHAGRAFERRRPTDFMLDRVEHGRGYTINAYAKKGVATRFPKLVYSIAYPNTGDPVATSEAF